MTYKKFKKIILEKYIFYIEKQIIILQIAYIIKIDIKKMIIHY